MIEIDWLVELFFCWCCNGGGGEDDDAYAESVNEKVVDEPFELEPELSWLRHVARSVFDDASDVGGNRPKNGEF